MDTGSKITKKSPYRGIYQLVKPLTEHDINLHITR